MGAVNTVASALQLGLGSPWGSLQSSIDLGIRLGLKYGASGYYEQYGGWNTALMIAGEFAGTTPFAEGIYGYDIGWGTPLSSFESGERLASGGLQMASWVAAGYGMAKGLGTPTSFTEADVQAAIMRLQSKGINPSEFQSHIDPQHVINLAEQMRAGKFDPARMDQPVILETTSQSLLSGHHRVIAAEMADFYLPRTPIAVPGTKPGDWSTIPFIPRRRQ